MTKTHIADIRLANNAGMNFPVCRAGDRLLNLDCGHWQMVKAEEVTCRRCQAAYARRYPWAMSTNRPRGPS